MRTAVSRLDVVRPRSLEHALDTLRDAGSDPLVPIAGCTDVLVTLNFGTQPARRFLDLQPLDELRGISLVDGMLRIGALTTYTEMIRSPLVNERVPALVMASREVGGVQIQNRGTLAGNVANASPAGDTLPVLAVMEATVVLASADGERRVPFLDFYTGYRATVMRPDELITAIEIPEVEGEQWFRKVGTRAAQAISKVVMAAVRGPEIRIAMGSVAPTVVRLRGVEEALMADLPIHAALASVGDAVRPVDDVRSQAEYRRATAKNLVDRWWR